MDASPSRRERWLIPSLWALRVCLSLAAAVYLFQAVSAGQFLDGDYAFLGVHRLGTTVADAMTFLALCAAAGLGWVARGSLLPFWAVLVALCVSQGQAGAGAARLIWLHVPLGVVLIGLVWAVAWSSWATAAWRRPRR